MSKKKTITTLSIAAGTAFIASLAMSNVANAEGANPFAMNELSSGYMQLAEGKTGGDQNKMKKDGKCGEGKCGGAKKKMKKDGKCGEGKCGGAKKKMKKDGESDSDMKKMKKDGKCGEGKCGGKK